jgi:FKBP-type peptidyl-prolyl cis-trans isomerase
MKFANTRRLAMAAGFVALLSLNACGGGGSSGSSSSTQSWADLSGSTSVTTLKITDTQVGTGTAVVNGQTLTVNYTGWLYDVRQPNQKGSQFDTSVGKTAFSFVLGAGQVIPGWDQGVVGMQVGGKRTLLIPASLAYGAAGAGNGAIPANAALIFDVELVSAQ